MRATILVDWGTSVVRACRLAGDGTVAGRRRLERPLAGIAPGGFRAVYDELTDGWAGPALLAGMVGSRQGWVEAPYVDCPAGLDDLARALTPVPGLEARIVPGVAGVGLGGAPDVMRGEEVQVFGAVDGGSALVILPGTHAKWARVEAGALAGFSTAMTGELFAVLRRHSLLAATTSDAPVAADDPSFRDGLAYAVRDGGLAHHLFAVRSRGLREALPPAAATAFLSGLLIGHEVAGFRRQAEAAQRIMLVGDAALAGLYDAALRQHGLSAERVDAEAATLRGLGMLARLA